VLFAITQPAALVGLLIAFLLGLTLRVVAMRLMARALGLADRRDPVLPNPREDIDPFGAVAAAVAGTGWGRPVDTDAMPRLASRGRRAAVVAAGPLTPLLVGVLGLLAYRLSFPEATVELLANDAGSVLRGANATSFLGQFALSVAVGLICFGALALIPLPPLDGFALLWLSMRHIGASGERARHWLVDNNIGVVILLLMVFFPLQWPLLYLLLNLFAVPVMWVLA
jgi:hypothetical protein